MRDGALPSSRASTQEEDGSMLLTHRGSAASHPCTNASSRISTRLPMTRPRRARRMLTLLPHAVTTQLPVGTFTSSWFDTSSAVSQISRRARATVPPDPYLYECPHAGRCNVVAKRRSRYVAPSSMQCALRVRHPRVASPPSPFCIDDAPPLVDLRTTTCSSCCSVSQPDGHLILSHTLPRKGVKEATRTSSLNHTVAHAQRRLLDAVAVSRNMSTSPFLHTLYPRARRSSMGVAPGGAPPSVAHTPSWNELHLPRPSQLTLQQQGSFTRCPRLWSTTCTTPLSWRLLPPP